MIGYNDILNNLFRRIENNSFSHSNIILGPDGSGKIILAKEVALKLINKEKNLDYVDIHIYKTTKASIGVDEVRKMLEEVSKKAYEGKNKVIILSKGDTLTIQAQNALLKTIEEPPIGVYIILLVESLDNLLDTIKSRSQVIQLYPLKNEEVEAYIKTIASYDPILTKVAINYSSGYPGKAIDFLNDDSILKLRNLIINLLFNLKNIQPNFIEYYENSFMEFKDKKDTLILLIITVIRDCIFLKEGYKDIINLDILNDLITISNMYSYNQLSSIISIVDTFRDNITNSSFNLSLSLLIISLSKINSSSEIKVCN